MMQREASKAGKQKLAEKKYNDVEEIRQWQKAQLDAEMDNAQKKEEISRSAIDGVKVLKQDHAEQTAEQKKAVDASREGVDKAHEEFREKAKQRSRQFDSTITTAEVDP